MASSTELLSVLCTMIQNPERGQRQNGLKKLLSFCESNELNEENCLDVFDYVYLHILKCFGDDYEKCRSLAASIVFAVLEKLPKNDFYISYIVPAIARRLGQTETFEPSEEMRLQWLELLCLIADKYRCEEEDEKDYLLKCYNEFIDILKKALSDPCPAAHRQACELIKKLSVATPSFHYQAESLVKPTLPLLKHKQSGSRILALEVLGIICLHITTNSECVLNILMDIMPLLMDPVPFVRRECGRVGCKLLLDFRDRYSFFDKILPLVLGCLSDETTEVKKEIESLWKKCGDQYFEENETELTKFEMVDDIPRNYPEDLMRPTIGCRALTQRSLKILDRVLNDMEEWKDEIRLQSTQILFQIIIHCEKAIGPHVFDIIPVLAERCNDENKKVAIEAIKVAKIMGIILDYGIWKEHSFESMKRSPNLGNLKCFTALFFGSGDEKKKENLNEILNIIIETDLCYKIDENFQKHLLLLIENLVNISLNNVETHNNLYKILVTIFAFCEDDSENMIITKSILTSFSKSNPEKLHNKFGEKFINNIEFLEEGCNESILLLNGLIVLAGIRPTYLNSLITAIKTVLNSENSEGKIKILSGIAEASRNWADNFKSEANEENMKMFLDEVLVPSITWKAGLLAEAIRSMATVSLYALARSDLKSSKTVIPEYISHIIGIIEDQDVTTRRFALKIILITGPMDAESLRKLSSQLLSRINDPNEEVRLSAISCLTHLQVKDGEIELWKPNVKNILQTISLHLHDPDLKMRTTLLNAVKEIGQKYPDEFNAVFNTIPITIPCKKDIEELKDLISTLKI